MITVEYLAIAPKTNTFCNSIKSFNSLMQVDAMIVIEGDQLHFNKTFSCKYEILSNEIKEKEQRYFHLKFSSSENSDEKINQFSDLLKTVRGIFTKIDSQPETLWDDISLHYSSAAYPIIHNVENLMRKLIANFMLVTIGREWVSETSPTEIKSIIDKSKRANELKGNALYNIDFIHLADFLLKAYSSTPSQDIYKKINSATKLQEFESIKKLLPESNWKRYFSSLVNCEDTFLQKRWSELYELRCKVAHNALVVKADFDTIQSLATELTEKLQDAIEKLPRVQVPEAEVENLVVNAAINANALIGEFVRVWNQLEGRLLDIAMEMNIPRRDVRSIVHKLAERGRLDEKQVRRFEFAISIRNSVIHSMNIEIGHEAIVGAIKHAKSLLSSLDVSPTPTHSWIAAIEKIDTSNF